LVTFKQGFSAHLTMTGCSDLSKVQSLAGALYAPAIQNGVCI
jgi:hypothetical protein